MTSDIRDWTGVSGRSVRKPQTTGGGLHVCPHCHEPVDDTPATHEIPARYLADPGTRTHLTEDTVDVLARWCASCDIILPIDTTHNTTHAQPAPRHIWILPDRANQAIQTPAPPDQFSDPHTPNPDHPPIIVHTSEPHDIDITRGPAGKSLAHADVHEPGWLGNPTLSERHGGTWPHDLAVTGKRRVVR